MVIIWVVESDNRLYIIGAPDSTWVEGATRSPDVRLRIGDNAYGMRATRIEPGRQDIFQMYIDRYKDNYPEIIALAGLPVTPNAPLKLVGLRQTIAGKDVREGGFVATYIMKRSLTDSG